MVPIGTMVKEDAMSSQHRRNIYIAVTLMLLWALSASTAARAQITVAAPTNLTAVASVDATAAPQVTLAWRDNSDNETNFLLYRGTSSNGGVLYPLATLAANTVGYTDKNVAPGVTYGYAVRAWYKSSTASVVSAYSNVASVM